MQRRIRFLESFTAVDTNGRTHKVRAYEHQVLLGSFPSEGLEHWESTGQTEYRLESGEPVEMLPDGAMRSRTSALELHR